MIDAQAPGVARRLQLLGATASSGANWQRPFFEGLSSLYLLVRAFERIEELSEPTRDDVLATLGMAEKQEDVLKLPAVKDRWQILAQEVEVEDRLRVQRTWVFGAERKRPALVLAFAHGTAPLDVSLAPGNEFTGELCFFPGNGVRAAVRARNDLTPLNGVTGFDSLDALCDSTSNLLARQPWVDEVAAPLRAVVSLKTNDGWAIADGERRSLPAAMSEQAGWTALAVSGGRAIDVAATFDGQRLRPLAVIADGEYVSLAPAAAGGQGV
jgi:hypothetical protein